MLRLYYFVIFVAFGIFLPFLPPWLENRGISGLGIGTIAALRPLTAIVSPVIFGIVADRFGLRGSLITGACFLSALSMGVAAILGFQPEMLTIVPLMAIVGLFSFFRAPVVSIADVTTMEGKKRGYGTIRLWGSLGFLIAAMTAGSLFDPTGPVLFPATIAVSMCCAGLISLGLPRGRSKPPPPNRNARSQLFKSTDFRLFLLIAFLWLASHSAYDVCLSLHLIDLGASSDTVGGAWALATIFEIFLMAFSGSVLRRHSPSKLLALAIGTMIIRWVGLAYTPWIWLILLQQPLHAFSFALFWLAGVDYIRTRAAPEILATAQGSFASAASLGSAFSMFAWGSLYDIKGGKGVFLVAAAVGLVALLVCWQFSRAPQKQAF